ncbi:MAG: PilN domain-containing protein [Bdellovibrionaceae bacterium]|nr:PilN domain-containing protein [Bdellovibrio sp.]
MIKINLLKSFAADGVAVSSSSTFSTDEEKNRVAIEFIKRLVVLLIGPLCLFLYEGQIIPELNAKLAQLTQVYNDTNSFNESKKGLADEIKKYEQEQAKINAQMNFIELVAKDKANEFKLFQHLQRVTPETIWINKLQFKESELLISAESDVPGDISKFLERLSSAEYLINISPVNQDIKSDAFGLGITTTLFTIKAQFNNAGSTR